MRTHLGSLFLTGLVLVSFLLSVSGCESLYEAGVPGTESFVNLKARAAEEEEYRQQYQSERSPAAMQWLLAHRIASGMPVADVGKVFGEAGVREYDDLVIKTNGGHYRSGDRVYRWGPDNGGRSIYLVFRDGRLVNFDPGEFREPILDRF